MVIVALPAQELIRMEGIEDERLFAPNVRQWLGNATNVNRDLRKSIEDTAEHKLFPAFHNGLTVLCEHLEVNNDALEINGYGVANGCQSLRGFFEKRLLLTPELKVLVKFIKESPTTPLAVKITDHTNNQNGISSRDLKSNHPLQKRLQTEINGKYGDEIFFRIKRGQHPESRGTTILENQLVGRMLLAFKMKRPEATHQAYKVFEDFYAEIFEGVSGDDVVVIYDIYLDILSKRDLFDEKLIGKLQSNEFLSS